MAATCVFLGIVLGSLSIIQISDVVEQNNEKILLEKVDALYLKANAKLDMMAGFVDLYAKFAYREITDVKALISSEEYFKNYKRRMEIALKAMTSSAMHPKTLYYKFGRVHWPREGLFIVRNGQTYIDHEITDLSLYAEDDIEHVGWYHLLVKNGAPTWMAPYDNANIDNARIISYVIPVIVNSEEIGVTGIDYDLNEITDVAAAANLAESSYGEAFVISKEGRVYYHPDISYGSLIFSEIESMTVPLLKTYKKLSSACRKLTFTFHSSFLPQKRFFASALAVPKNKLLTFDVMLQRLKFPTNESVHICIDLMVSACRFE